MQLAGHVLELALLAGVLGLDATAALQLMFSRPLVAGGIAGWILGDPGMGLASGSLVELLWMGGVPVGSLVPPNGTIASVFAAATAILLPQWQPSLAPLAAASLGLLVAVPVGMFAARTEIWQRRFNGRLSRSAEQAVLQGRWGGIVVALLGGLFATFARSFLTMLAVLILGVPVLARLMENMPADAVLALEWGYWLAWLLGLAVAADYFWERRNLRYILLALVSMAVLGTRQDVSQKTLLFTACGIALLGGLWRWRRAWVESKELV